MRNFKLNNFETDKQEICLKLTKLILITPDPLAKIGMSDIANQLQELQPQAMPTCSTCDYLNKGTCWYECCNERSPFHTCTWVDETVEDICCTYHSALEHKDE